MWDAKSICREQHMLPALGCCDMYRYLGVNTVLLKQGFSDIHADFTARLGKVKNGPLKDLDR